MDGFTSDEDEDGMGSAAADLSKPWLQEFRLYLDGADTVPFGIPLIKWWGVRTGFVNYSFNFTDQNLAD